MYRLTWTLSTREAFTAVVDIAAGEWLFDSLRTTPGIVGVELWSLYGDSTGLRKRWFDPEFELARFVPSVAPVNRGVVDPTRQHGDTEETGE